MKKIITKIFLSTFVVWFFSLWLSFVYGQNCNVWTQCYTQWCSNAANYSWFNNSTNAYSVCSSDSTCKAYLDWDSKYGDWGWLTHVQWNIPKIWSMVNLSVPNQWWCSNQTNPTCQGVANNVKTMQNTLKVIWCFQQHDEQRWNDGDCLLGYDTLYDMTHCCILPWESLPQITSPWPSAKPSCSWNLTLITNNYNQKCCVLKIECKQPKITINWKENETKYTDNSVLKVEVDYSNNTEWSIAFSTWEITIIWWTGSNFVANTVSKKITFDLTPSWDTNTITINVKDDCWKLEGEKCPPVDITLDRDIPCQDKKKWAQCTNSGDFLLSGDATDLSALNGQKCKLEWYDNSGLDFCPGCDFIKKSEKSCEESHWSWRYEDTNWCCVNCGSDKKWDKDNCVCIKTNADCESKWERLNEKTCKCECDPTKKCCGILLNTVVPFIGDCIEMTTQNDVSSSNDSNTSTVNQLNAFPFLMMGLSKIVVTVILIFSFLIIIAAWLMMTTWVYSEQNYKKGMERVQKVVVGLILLWASGLILKLINPSFFGG